jgi:hypothetical protein
MTVLRGRRKTEEGQPLHGSERLNHHPDEIVLVLTR